MAERYYPVGIQTFSEIIKGGYVYIDKTDLMWRMQHKRKYIFLSRPRRFGKSLLSSTLHSFFNGEKDLFKGLKVMEYEKEWEKYPVLHIDLSTTKSMASTEELSNKILQILKDYCDLYGKDADEETPGSVLYGVIRRAYRQTGRQVVIIVDEYDAPLLDVLRDINLLNGMRRVMQEFYAPLKACEAMIKFCFITGITKFSQLSIFSTINNLNNISMWSEFSAICGITEQELTTQLQEDITSMAAKNRISKDEMHTRLKMQYDGYHFSEESEEIYTPFSLLKAFDSKKISSYWFESGTPSFLVKELKYYKTNIMSFDNLDVPASAFDQPTEDMEDALPLLYQSGYLTIKDYNQELDTYTLSIPNQEVRIGYTKGLLPAYTGLKATDVQMGFAAKFWRALKNGDIDHALQEMQSYMASIPYVEGFKQKLANAATAEGFYEYTLYLIFSMLNVYVKTQVKCAGGKADMIVWMPDTIYIFVFKVSDTAEKALEQIESNGYSLPFKTDSRKVIEIGVRFDKYTRAPLDWIIRKSNL